MTYWYNVNCLATYFLCCEYIYLCVHHIHMNCIALFDDHLNAIRLYIRQWWEGNKMSDTCSVGLCASLNNVHFPPPFWLDVNHTTVAIKCKCWSDIILTDNSDCTRSANITIWCWIWMFVFFNRSNLHSGSVSDVSAGLPTWQMVSTYIMFFLYLSST